VFRLFIIFILIHIASAKAVPELYEKKEGITTDKVKAGSRTFFTFGFKDLDGTYREWNWAESNRNIQEKGLAFGLTGKDPNNFSYYSEELSLAMFKEHPQLGVIPDYSLLVSYYGDFVRPLYEKWKKTSGERSLGKRESIELLLQFFQDYPYGVPPNIKNDRFTAGLFVAPYVFNEGYGDCDSKALLMASVLSHDQFFKDRLAMILVPGHALLGLNMRPSVYDETFKYRHSKYIVAEPTGLARTPFGRKNSPYKKVLGIEPIRLQVASIPSTSIGSISTSDTQDIKPIALKVLENADCPDGALLIDYVSPSSNRRIQMCQIKVNGQYIKHGPEVMFSSSGSPESIKVYKNGAEL
jgi:hypothetical protein